jgi:hypothetical protein
MGHTKKLVLVEPQVIEQLQLNNEYKDLQKKPGVKTKSVASLDLRNMLAQPELPDDLKAKLYQQALSRFLNLTDEITPITKASINSLTRPVPPTYQHIPLQLPQVAEAAAKRKRKVPRRYSPQIQLGRFKRTKTGSRRPLWLDY